MNGRKYIAYGSNLNREQMAKRCPDAKVIGSGMLKDYELLFRGYTDAAVATVEPKEGENVPVLIWEISPRDEVNLDRYEGYPRLYGKQMLEVEVEGGCEKMMAYIMKDGPTMGIPSGHSSSPILPSPSSCIIRSMLFLTPFISTFSSNPASLYPVCMVFR